MSDLSPQSGPKRTLIRSQSQWRKVVNARLAEKLHSNDFYFLPASRYRAPARQSRSTAPTVARVVEPFLSALHLLACRLVGSLRKGLGASSSQACLARLSVSRPPAHWPKNR